MSWKVALLPLTYGARNVRIIRNRQRGCPRNPLSGQAILGRLEWRERVTMRFVHALPVGKPESR